MTRALYISYNGLDEPIVQSQVIPYLKGLSAKGIKFYLITFEKTKMSPERERKLRDMLNSGQGHAFDIEWHALRYHKRPQFLCKLLDITWGFFYIVFMVISRRIDVVHARALVSQAMGYPAAKILFRKILFDTRGIDSEEYVDGGLWKRDSFKHRLAKRLEKIFINGSDHVIVLTERFLKILNDMYKGKKISYTVIPCAADTDIFRPMKKDNVLLKDLGLEGKFVLVYSGSIGTWYMLGEMIDFFKTLSKRDTKAHFLILTHKGKDDIEKAFREKGIGKECFTVKRAEYARVPDYLSLCDAGIFFIKPVFSKLSSSPCKFGEYLAAGLPVVINRDIGDTDKIVLRYNVGAVIHGFDREHYAQAVDTITDMIRIDREGLRRRCRNCAVNELSLKKAVQNYYDVYESVGKL